MPPQAATPSSPLDRRPIRSRRLALWRHAAAALARARVPPNLISVVGMLAACAAGALLWWTSRDDAPLRACYIAAAALIQLRLIANMLDGMVAVEGGMRSAVGDLYNEVPDRVSDGAVLIGAGYAASSSPTLGYLAALLAVFVAYSRALGKGAGFPSDFRGPMAKQQRMFLVTIASLYLALAPGSWQLARVDLGPIHVAGLMPVVLAVIAAGCVITAVRRLASLAAAMRSRGVTP